VPVLAGHPKGETAAQHANRLAAQNFIRRKIMGRGILLWLLGVPIPIIILLALIWH
jgi:hypothetical protein